MGKHLVSLAAATLLAGSLSAAYIVDGAIFENGQNLEIKIADLTSNTPIELDLSQCPILGVIVDVNSTSGNFLFEENLSIEQNGTSIYSTLSPVVFPGERVTIHYQKGLADCNLTDSNGSEIDEFNITLQNYSIQGVYIQPTADGTIEINFSQPVWTSDLDNMQFRINNELNKTGCDAITLTNDNLTAQSCDFNISILPDGDYTLDFESIDPNTGANGGPVIDLTYNLSLQSSSGGTFPGQQCDSTLTINATIPPALQGQPIFVDTTDYQGEMIEFARPLETSTIVCGGANGTDVKLMIMGVGYFQVKPDGSLVAVSTLPGQDSGGDTNLITDSSISIDLGSTIADRYKIEGTIEAPFEINGSDLFAPNNIYIDLIDFNATNISPVFTIAQNGNFALFVPKDHNITLHVAAIENGSYTGLYTKDDGNHTFNSWDTLIGENEVEFNCNDAGCYPDMTTTGFYTIDHNITGIDLNITQFFANQKEFNITLTFPSTSSERFVNVSLLDAATGNWIGGGWKECDEEGCNIKARVGSEWRQNGYILQIDIDDFGSGTGHQTYYYDANSQSLKAMSEITFNALGLPEISPLQGNGNILNLNIAIPNIEATLNTLSGTLANTPEHDFQEISVLSLSTYSMLSTYDLPFTFHLPNGNYTLEYSYNFNNTSHHYYYCAGQFVEDVNIQWSLESNTSWIPRYGDTACTIDLSSDEDLGSIPIAQTTTYTARFNISGVGSGGAFVDIFNQDHWFGGYDNTTDNNEANVTIQVVPGDYYIGVYNDGIYYILTNNGTALSPNVGWVEENGFYHPNTSTISIGGDTTFDLSTATDLVTLTLNIALGDEFANKDIDIDVWKRDGDFGAYTSVRSNAQGEVNTSIKLIKDGEYRIDVWSEGSKGYTVENNSTLIPAAFGWSPSTGQPKENTFFTISNDTTFDITMQTYNELNLTFQGRLPQECIYAQLQGSSNNTIIWADNFNYQTFTCDKDMIKMEAPQGNYMLYIYADQHPAGFVNDGNSSSGDIISSDTTIMNFGDIAVADLISVDGNYTIDLQAQQLYYIAGSIAGPQDQSKEGSIEAIDVDTNLSRWSPVTSTGEFNITGVPEGNYTIRYYGDNGTYFTAEANVTGNIDDLSVGGTTYQASYTITNSSGYDLNLSAMLIEAQGVDQWSVIQTNDCETVPNNQICTGSFLITQGANYFIAIGLRSRNAGTGETIYRLYDTNESNNSTLNPTLNGINGIDSNDSLSLSVNVQ